MILLTVYFRTFIISGIHFIPDLKKTARSRSGFISPGYVLSQQIYSPKLRAQLLSDRKSRLINICQ